MKGVKSEDLLAIIDFLYYGEANISYENLDSFMNIAEELELKGLDGKVRGGGGGKGAGEMAQQSHQSIVPSPCAQKNNDTFESKISSQEISIKGNGNGRMVKVYVCQSCGKEGTRPHIKNHIEANHLEGISIPCNICERTFR